jgi:hypothetical protein
VSPAIASGEGDGDPRVADYCTVGSDVDASRVGVPVSTLGKRLTAAGWVTLSAPLVAACSAVMMLRQPVVPRSAIETNNI